MLDCTGNASCDAGYQCRNWDAAGANECVPPEGSSSSSDVGGPCASDADCSSGYVCYTSLDNGQTTFPGGYCSNSCFPQFIPCPTADGLCTSSGYCANACTSSFDCRPGYSCVANPSSGGSVCMPS